LLAIPFAVLLIASVSHIASYSGFLVIQSRPLQNLLTWVLVPLALWKILLSGDFHEIPRGWRTLVFLAWLYASILAQFLPVVRDSYVWPRILRWFGLDRVPSVLFKARASSAGQVAAALSLFLILWYRPLAGGADTQSPEKRGFNWPPRVRWLAVFGVALPMGILIAGNIFWEPQNRNPQLIEWIAIIAAFWFIVGGIVTGMYLLRDGLRRGT